MPVLRNGPEGGFINLGENGEGLFAFIGRKHVITADDSSKFYDLRLCKGTVMLWLALPYVNRSRCCDVQHTALKRQVKIQHSRIQQFNPKQKFMHSSSSPGYAAIK